MDFNFSKNLEYCGLIVSDVADLLNYSHIPSAFAAVLIGLLILFKSQFSLLGKILFSISLSFSLWVLSNLLIWNYYYKGSVVMAAWASIEIFSILIFTLCFYFTFVYIEKKDVKPFTKIIALIPLLISIFVSPTSWNLMAYDIQECIAVENPIYADYFLAVKVIFSSLIVIYSVFKFIVSDKSLRKQIILLGTGLLVFLWSFLVSGYIAETTGSFIYEAGGLFGMVIFIAFLGYLIVKFNAFNIKLIATQALVITIIFLTSAELLYVNGKTDLILTISTLIFICFAGYFLTKSVQREIKQREKIEKLATDLEAANEQLKELDKQKDELLGLVSHQLATPISGLKWNLEMFIDGDLGTLNEKQMEEMKTMQGVAGNLADLASMILDVSRIQLGKMKIDKSNIDIRQFFVEIFDVVEQKAKEKKIEFKHDLPANMKMGFIDKRLTHMTIENLVSNAIKYTPNNGKVLVDTKLENGVLKVMVKDTGVGIPKADQAKIFGKLYRASNVAAVDGNGFGLFIAKGAIEAQGGKIWFESEEGKGTAFYVELPIVEQKAK